MGERKGLERSVMTVIFATVFLFVLIVMIWYVIMPYIQFSILDKCWADFASDTGTLVTGIYTFGYKNVTLDFGSCATGLFFVNKDKFDTIKTIISDAEKTINAEEGSDRDIPLTELVIGQCNQEEEAFIIAVPWFGKKLELGGPVWWIVGGAAIGAWGSGSNYAIRKIPLARVVGAAVGIGSGMVVRNEMIEHFAELEERGKKTLCYSIDRPFESKIGGNNNYDFNFIPGVDAVTDDKGNYIPYEGKYCVLLFKGKTQYYVRSYPDPCTTEKNQGNIEGDLDTIRKEEMEITN
jgi:hypothetical protein